MSNIVNNFIINVTTKPWGQYSLAYWFPFNITFFYRFWTLLTRILFRFIFNPYVFGAIFFAGTIAVLVDELKNNNLMPINILQKLKNFNNN